MCVGVILKRQKINPRENHVAARENFFSALLGWVEFPLGKRALTKRRATKLDTCVIIYACLLHRHMFEEKTWESRRGGGGVFRVIPT